MDIKLVRKADDLKDAVLIEAYKILNETGKYESCFLINNTIKFTDTIMTSAIVLSENSLVFVIPDPKRIFVVNKSNSKYSIVMDDPDCSFNYESLTEDEALKKLVILGKRQAI